jgi:hypothetical protein
MVGVRGGKAFAVSIFLLSMLNRRLMVSRSVSAPTARKW